MSGVALSAAISCSLQPKIRTTACYNTSVSPIPWILCSSDPKIRCNRRFSRFTAHCNSGPSCPLGSGDSRSVLDAFFLGKALAEVINERIESTVGEFLSTIGRLQAEQQKQVQGFQDEVLVRAKGAKEEAAHDAMEAQGLISPSKKAGESADGNPSPTSFSPSDVTSAPISSASGSATDPSATSANPIMGVSNGD
ncbi:hypothetical protein RJ641_030087 [Dillenia turbinata]|uniref:Uncharacterized protein n=1 Tax=Dillenia turbinata TaxID=194707 RepID=A0AAN8W363_9MAGN